MDEIEHATEDRVLDYARLLFAYLDYDDVAIAHLSERLTLAERESYFNKIAQDKLFLEQQPSVANSNQTCPTKWLLESYLEDLFPFNETQAERIEHHLGACHACTQVCRSLEERMVTDREVTLRAFEKAQATVGKEREEVSAPTSELVDLLIALGKSLKISKDFIKDVLKKAAEELDRLREDPLFSLRSVVPITQTRGLRKEPREIYLDVVEACFCNYSELELLLDPEFESDLRAKLVEIIDDKETASKLVAIAAARWREDESASNTH